VYFIAGWA